jgi:hypothetical protein
MNRKAKLTATGLADSLNRTPMRSTLARNDLEWVRKAARSIDDVAGKIDQKASLVNGKVPSSELPSYVDDVIEVANYAALPATGEGGKIYVTLDTNKTYRWGGTTYVEIGNPDLDNYIQKKSGATTGNFAKFTATGDIEDSEKKPADFAPAITASGILKGDGAGGVSAATAGTDFQAPLGFTPENASNKVTSLTAQSTDTQYPSAKCVYDAIQGVDVKPTRIYNEAEMDALDDKGQLYKSLEQGNYWMVGSYKYAYVGYSESAYRWRYGTFDEIGYDPSNGKIIERDMVLDGGTCTNTALSPLGSTRLTGTRSRAYQMFISTTAGARLLPRLQPRWRRPPTPISRLNRFQTALGRLAYGQLATS